MLPPCLNSGHVAPACQPDVRETRSTLSNTGGFVVPYILEVFAHDERERLQMVMPCSSSHGNRSCLWRPPESNHTMRGTLSAADMHIVS